MNMTARPLSIVDGATRGPNGLPLSPFARFAARIAAGGSLDDDPTIVELTAAPRPRRRLRRLLGFLHGFVRREAPRPRPGTVVVLADRRVLEVARRFTVENDGSMTPDGGR